MKEFFKVFIRGIVVTILLPFIVVLLALYTVYCIIVFAIMLIRNIVVFFMGGSISDTKEDIEARKILAQQAEMKQNMSEMLAGLMHSAIEQNPQAVQAMAAQQMAAQQTPTVQQPAQIGQPTNIANDVNPGDKSND